MEHNGATASPKPRGWFAEDLDRLPEAPRRTGLIDRALVIARIAPRPVTVVTSDPENVTHLCGPAVEVVKV